MGDARVQALDFYTNQYVVVADKAFRFDGNALVDVRSKPIKGFSPLNVDNNGLRQIAQKLVGSPLVGYVRLTRSVRSPVAEMFARLA